MRKKFIVISLSIGILSSSISTLVYAQNKNEVALATESEMSTSNVNEAKQSIAAYIQEDLQKYDTGASAAQALNSSESVINPKKVHLRSMWNKKKYLTKIDKVLLGMK